MIRMPVLRVVPLDRLRRHEEVDPIRLELLAGRIEEKGTQVNPMVGVEDPGGEILLLDGATRTEALKRLGIDFGVVQTVDPMTVSLQTWHHVIRQCDPTEVLAEIAARKELLLAGEEGRPRLHLSGGETRSVLARSVTAHGALTRLVGAYIGRWTVNRVADPALDSVSWRFPDWGVVVEFPTLEVDEVLRAALNDDLLPAGVTRFLVPERALLLNLDLNVLRSPGPVEEKQETLDRVLEARAGAGRIRRYEEPVFVLDD